MSAAPSTAAVENPVPSTTLLELVQTILEETDDDREVVATVVQLIRTGKVRLCGNFRDNQLDLLR